MRRSSQKGALYAREFNSWCKLSHGASGGCGGNEKCHRQVATSTRVLLLDRALLVRFRCSLSFVHHNRG
jgi:hypothetical protein